MEIVSILTILIVATIACERIFKHITKSKCCGGELLFNNNASAPDFSTLLRK